MLFGKHGEGEQVAAPIDVRLGLCFEDENDLIIDAEGRRFRIAWEDMTALVEKRKPVKKEIPFDGPAIEKFIRLERLLGHGLDFGRIGKLLGESPDEVRTFYGWAHSRPTVHDSPVKFERARQTTPDVLALTVAQVGPDGGRIEEARLCARDVLRLMGADGDTKVAAKSLGVSAEDLGAWLESNANLMAALK